MLRNSSHSPLILLGLIVSDAQFARNKILYMVVYDFFSITNNMFPI